MKMSDLRRYQMLDDSVQIESVVSLMRRQVDCQSHLDVIRCGRWLRKQSVVSAQTLQWELISLLSLVVSRKQRQFIDVGRIVCVWLQLFGLYLSAFWLVKIGLNQSNLL